MTPDALKDLALRLARFERDASHGAERPAENRDGHQ